LAGLDYVYLKRRLQQWNEGYHAAAGHPMVSIASKLSDDQIEALASYLSFVR
jgi:cytochrome c553